MQLKHLGDNMESTRLASVEARDGIAGALEFAKRTMVQYRRAVLNSRKRGSMRPSHGSIPEYRRGFIESYLSFKKYIKAHSRKELVVFDIDDTLFTTLSRVLVMRSEQIVKILTTDEYNNYTLDYGEAFDYSQFASAKYFNETSLVIESSMQLAKDIYNEQTLHPHSEMILLTARGDFDNKELFLDTFREHKFPIDDVYVERVGGGIGTPAEKKAIVIRRYLDSGKYDTLKFFDDSVKNLTAIVELIPLYPNVKFKTYLCKNTGATAYSK